VPLHGGKLLYFALCERYYDSFTCLYVSRDELETFTLLCKLDGCYDKVFAIQAPNKDLLVTTSSIIRGFIVYRFIGDDLTTCNLETRIPSSELFDLFMLRGELWRVVVKPVVERRMFEMRPERSRDSGLTWEQLPPIMASWISKDPLAERVIVGMDTGLLHSADLIGWQKLVKKATARFRRGWHGANARISIDSPRMGTLGQRQGFSSFYL
jgi:hypothetical protein